MPLRKVPVAPDAANWDDTVQRTELSLAQRRSLARAPQPPGVPLLPPRPATPCLPPQLEGPHYSLQVERPPELLTETQWDAARAAAAARSDYTGDCAICRDIFRAEEQARQQPRRTGTE